ncbi:MAG: O-antigen ligase family protein [Clostridia bacterium]|nr:O-antigen ligase family protein [Clostridia bacterium]
MVLAKKKVFDYLELAFKLSFLFLGFFNFNAFTFGTVVTSILVKITVPLAGICVLYRLFHIKHYLKDKVLIVLILFWISGMITLLLSWEYGYMSQLKTMIWLAMQLALLYATDIRKTTEERKKEIHLLMYVFVAFLFVSSIASFVLMGIRYRDIRFYEGIRIVSGYIWGRLWGVYTDPNYAGVMVTISILFSLYILPSIQNRLAKAFFIANIILQGFYICFSDSRTAMVAAFIGLAIHTYCVFFRKLTVQKTFWKSVTCVVLAVLVGIGFLASTSAVKKGYNEIIRYVASHQTPVDPDDPDGDIEEVDPEELLSGRTEDIENDISNRRFDLWGSAIETFAARPVFGVAFDSLKNFVEKNLPETYLVNNDYGKYDNYHNTLFNILVGQGAVGFILFMIAAVMVAVRGLRVLSYHFHKENGSFYAMIFSVVAVVLVSAMFLKELVYTLSPNTFLFWLFLGAWMREGGKKGENA